MGKTDNSEIISPGRQNKDGLTKQLLHFTQFPMLMKFIDAIPIPVMVLNKQRQVVYSNKILLDITGKEDFTNIFGMRPGEILNCSHAFESEGGCGTTEFCTTCGSLKAIMVASEGVTSEQETRITKTNNEALDLRVYSSPLQLDDDEFTIFAVRDVSDEKRRQNLERIFFHDLLNTASSLKALAYNLESADQKDSDEFRLHLMKLSDKLVDEICAQRDIYAAEVNELSVNLIRCDSLSIVKEVVDQFSFYYRDINIIVTENSVDCIFFSDKVLLRRIISNMLKNALEASTPGATVTISVARDTECIIFSIHNEAFIPREVQLQIFQRSFSTKGFGRGVGTYSMKLLCENYLHGKISFRTDEKRGTTFFCKIPLNLD